MIVLNFFAGPGSGKSTAAAALFAKLKGEGFRVEMAREVAKDFIWEGREDQLHRNQALISAMQYGRLKDLDAAGADIAVTDSPLLLGEIYSKSSPYHRELVTLLHKQNEEFVNRNVFVNRVKPYVKFGRLQEEADARALDSAMYDLGYPYYLTIDGSDRGQSLLFNTVMMDDRFTQLRRN